MVVRRIVANLEAATPVSAAAFYREIFGLDTAMDHGWIVTLAAPETMTVQLSLASEGGNGTPVPVLSIEVDDLDVVLGRIAARGLVPEYGPVEEPWGVRRFFVRDPAGRLLNILSHL